MSETQPMTPGQGQESVYSFTIIMYYLKCSSVTKEFPCSPNDLLLRMYCILIIDTLGDAKNVWKKSNSLYHSAWLITPERFKTLTYRFSFWGLLDPMMGFLTKTL